MNSSILTVLLILQLSNLQLGRGFHWPFQGSSNTNGKHEVEFNLYQKRSTLDTPVVSGSLENFNFQKLVLEKPIVITIHGWRGHAHDVFTTTMVNEFLSKKDYNIISVDWSALGSRDPMYPTSCKNVPEVALQVSKFLDKLCAERGIKLEDLHIIGHSLGAHIAGIAGYLVKSGKIGRITGLDPAGPSFSLDDTLGRLSTNSANFVDVIHTSSNYLGMGFPLGHVDFFPNGPYMFQPGCGFDVIGRCSHRRSYFFFAESLSKPRAFLAVPCDDWNKFTIKECDLHQAIPMGEATPTTARGVFYLETNSKSPYGRGAVWST